jgi:hypothetical protein
MLKSWKPSWISFALGIVTGAGLMFTACVVHAEPLRIIKTVPEGSTLELRVHGNVVQSMAVQPGTYEISIRDVGNDGAVHGRPRRHR